MTRIRIAFGAGWACGEGVGRPEFTCLPNAWRGSATSLYCGQVFRGEGDY